MKLQTLPKGYQLKKGIEYSENLKRYLWRPVKGSLFYSKTKKVIYLYLKWASLAETDGILGKIARPDGYAEIKEERGGSSFWVSNMDVRNCIPLEIIE